MAYNYWDGNLTAATRDYVTSQGYLTLEDIDARYDARVSGLEAKTDDYTILPSDKNTIFTNAGAEKAITFTLPAPVSGLRYTFIIKAAYLLEVQTDTATDTTNAIAWPTTGRTYAVYEDADLNSIIELEAVDGNTWLPRWISGSWFTR